MGEVVQFIQPPQNFRYTLKQKATIARRYNEAKELFEKYSEAYLISDQPFDKALAQGYFDAMNFCATILEHMDTKERA